MYLCVRAHVECICFLDGGNSGPPPGVENDGGRQVPQTAQRYLEAGTRKSQASLVYPSCCYTFPFLVKLFCCLPVSAALSVLFTVCLLFFRIFRSFTRLRACVLVS